MHIPVLLQETISYLQPRPGGKYIDGTVGGGGHAKAILQASNPDGLLLAFDRDSDAIDHAREQLKDFSDRLTFIQASYGEMAAYSSFHGFGSVDGILLDLGLSSRQLEKPERGFSFSLAGPLDMRFDTSKGISAAEMLNDLSEEAIAEILWRYGELKNSRHLAKAIVEERPINTTDEMVDLVLRKMKPFHKSRIHPATLVFQALRIAVNGELDELEKGLTAATGILKTGGRLVVISFHSLEDRIVKQFFRDKSKSCICPPEQPVCTCNNEPLLSVVTRKVVRPDNTEITRNPRSRSARLRVAQKLAGGQA